LIGDVQVDIERRGRIPGGGDAVARGILL